MINKNIIIILGIFFIMIGIKQSLAQEAIVREMSQVTLHLRGVHDAKVSVSAYVNGNYSPPLKEIPDVTGTVQLSIPAEYLPGQFLLRMDYRQKAEDQPYPAEFVFFMNNHDLELGINPLYIRPDSIDFGNDDENPAYFSFQSENGVRRQQLALLEQLLAGYDSRTGRFFKATEEEFEKRRIQYNQWIAEQEQKDKRLFVSRLIAFQKVNPVTWNLSARQHLQEQALRYFDQINLQDALLLRVQAFNDYLNSYISLFGTQIRNEQQRDSMFTEAGRIACEKASQGDPKVYGWIVDFFYRGYETYGISSGIKMLEQHIQNPRCLTSKKLEIIRRLEGMEKLRPGAEAPSFEAEMANGMQVRFNGISKDKSYGLLLFYDSDCSHCKELLQELKTWIVKPQNGVWFDAITIAVDQVREKWKSFHDQENYPWTDVWASGGINSKVANDYYILSTPVIYIIDKQMKVMAMPQNIKEIDKFLNP